MNIRIIAAAALATLIVSSAAAQQSPRERIERLEAGVVRLAQYAPRPPRDVPLADDAGDEPQGGGGLVLRIDRLESQLRAMTGQVEQLQFQQRKLEESLRKFQQDVDLRLQDAAKRAPAARRSDGAAQDPAPAPAGPNVAAAPARARRPVGSDVFDPAAEPNAPGAPRPLGNPANSIIVEPGAPVDINRANPVEIPNPGLPPSNALQPASPLGEYDQALALFRQGQYETAETGFKNYLQKNPAGRLTPDAVFYLGETYFQRQRHREAAEQYLKLSTDFSKSGRAPDGLVRLGMSLNALGAREQACAAFGEVSRKYPGAAAAIRGADRESKRARC